MSDNELTHEEQRDLNNAIANACSVAETLTATLYDCKLWQSQGQPTVNRQAAVPLAAELSEQVAGVISDLETFADVLDGLTEEHYATATPVTTTT